MNAKAKNYTDVCIAMAGWTVTERIRFVAEELENLTQILHNDPHYSVDAMAMGEIEMQNYQTAIQMVEGNWEPADPPGWEGGFAENH